MKGGAYHFLKCTYNPVWSPTTIISKGQDPEEDASEEDEPCRVIEPPKPTTPTSVNYRHGLIISSYIADCPIFLVC
jgi:hypothetical protein